MPQFVGQISLLPLTFEPRGWIFCDGRVLPISENETLFTRIGTTFGGDGESTFAVPDLRAIAPKNCQYCISLFGDYEPSVGQMLLGYTMISVVPPKPPALLECAGETLPTAKYMTLETLMGNRFGGDKNNFGMPDLRSKAPANCKYMMVAQGIFPGSRIEGMFASELVLLPYEPPYAENLRLANGDLLNTEKDVALFILLGNRFGGDEKQKTFALPDLRAAAPSKFNYYICIQGVFPPRS